MTKWKQIEIDGIKALARRDSEAPSHYKWEIVLESNPSYSLLPPSWRGCLSAGTLEGAVYIVRNEVFKRMGIDKIKQRIKEVAL
jgi:hypothetical protein